MCKILIGEINLENIICFSAYRANDSIVLLRAYILSFWSLASTPQKLAGLGPLDDTV